MAIADKLTKLQNDISSAYTTISSKGGTIPSDKNTNNLSNAINSIPSGDTPEPIEKDVNFYDYDGTRLYSYTKTEFLQLESMPENPTHEGLVAQGWNTTLADAKTYMNTYDFLQIGQMYNTTHNGFEFEIELREYSYTGLTIKVASVTNEATIYWGDNSTSVLNSSTLEQTHNYAQPGNYLIKIVGEITINSAWIDTYYKRKITSIRVGTNVTLSGTQVFYDFTILRTITIANKTDAIVSNYVSLFHYCRNLKCIVLPIETKTLPEGMTQECSFLQYLVLPTKVTSTSLAIYIPSSFIRNAQMIRRISMPMNVTRINSYSVSCAYSIERLVIPYTVNTVSNLAFSTARTIKIYDFTYHYSVPTLSNINAFNDQLLDYKIVVPDNLYSTWITTNNWSNTSIANHIIKESDL